MPKTSSNGHGGRVLVKTDARGWYVDAANPEGGKVRKSDNDRIFDNIVEAQTALAGAGTQATATSERPANGRQNGDVPTTVAPTGKILVGKTITIKCAKRGCNNTRVIKPQDRFQVKFCVEHQLEHKRELRRARAKARRDARQKVAA